MPMHTQSFGKASETIVLVTGLILLLALIYVILPSLSPFLLLGAILFLLYPARQHLYIRRIMWLAALLFVAWFFSTLVGVLTPFILAFVLAYLFNPVVNYFERWSVRRWITSLVIMFVLLGTIVSVFVLFVPVMVEQFSNIIGNISNFVRVSIEYMRSSDFTASLAQYGIPVERIQQMISQEFPQRLEAILKSVLEGAFGFFSSLTSVIGRVVDAIIIPFVAFYLLKDYPSIIDRVASFIPDARRDTVSRYFGKVDVLLGHYVRGILIVALIQGVCVAVGLTLIGVQNSLVLGIMSGTLSLVPFVGFYSSLVISAIVALLSGGAVVTKVVLVIALYVSLNILENTVLAPRIIGSKVGIHPALLILSLTVFGYFLGFVGLLIAVPVTAVILLTLGEWETTKNGTASADNGDA
jgi:predicted PurR-regulated permease PerM